MAIKYTLSRPTVIKYAPRRQTATHYAPNRTMAIKYAPSRPMTTNFVFNRPMAINYTSNRPITTIYASNRPMTIKLVLLVMTYLLASSHGLHQDYENVRMSNNQKDILTGDTAFAGDIIGDINTTIHQDEGPIDHSFQNSINLNKALPEDGQTAITIEADHVLEVENKGRNLNPAPSLNSIKSLTGWIEIPQEILSSGSLVAILDHMNVENNLTLTVGKRNATPNRDDQISSRKLNTKLRPFVNLTGSLSPLDNETAVIIRIKTGSKMLSFNSRVDLTSNLTENATQHLKPSVGIERKCERNINLIALRNSTWPVVAPTNREKLLEANRSLMTIKDRTILLKNNSHSEPVSVATRKQETDVDESKFSGAFSDDIWSKGNNHEITSDFKENMSKGNNNKKLSEFNLTAIVTIMKIMTQNSVGMSPGEIRNRILPNRFVAIKPSQELTNNNGTASQISLTQARLGGMSSEGLGSSIIRNTNPTIGGTQIDRLTNVVAPTRDTEERRMLFLELPQQHQNENMNRDPGSNNNKLSLRNSSSIPKSPRESNGTQFLEPQKNYFVIASSSYYMNKSTGIINKPSQNIPILRSAISSPLEDSKCSSELHGCDETCYNCTCHWTCKAYNTCCDGCQSQNTGEINAISLTTFSKLECKDNTFFESSCLGKLSRIQWEKMKISAEFFAKQDENIPTIFWWYKYIDRDISYIDLQKRCENTDSNPDLLYNAPFSDDNYQTHYKNVFCAICQNVRFGDFWKGFVKCQSTSGPNKVSHEEQTNTEGNRSDVGTSSHPTTIDQITSDKSCRLLWLPEYGRMRSCTKNSETVSATSTEEPLKRRNPSVVTEPQFIKGRKLLAMIDRRSEMTLNPLTTTDDNIEPTVTKAEAVQCNSSIADIPVNGGVWYSFQHKFVNNETASSEWDINPGIDESYINAIQILQEERMAADRQTHFIIDDFGDFLTKLFTFRVSLTFTFERTGVLRGDFTKEVIKYSTAVKDTFQSRLSNTISCSGGTTTNSQKEGSSHIFTSQIEMKCAETMTLNTNFDPHLTNLPSKKADLARYTAFVGLGFDKLQNVYGAIALPVTIDYIPCVTLEYISSTESNRFCTSMSASYVVVRAVNAIFGKISLEALISIICMVLSVIGLVTRLALQRIVPFYNSYPGKVQFCLCVSLLAAYVFFLMGGIAVDGTVPCRVASVLAHLAFLSAIFWMNVTAFEIWRTFRHWSSQVVTRGTTSLILSTVYALGIPVGLVAACLILDEHWPWSQYAPSYGRPSCWLNGTRAVAIFFVAPCSFISFVNVIFVGLTLRGLRRQRESISEFRKSRNNMAATDTSIVVKIVFLVGITWLFGLLAALVDNIVLWIIFTILNASLGFSISVVLVLNRRVFSVVKKRCFCYKEENNTDSTVTTTSKLSIKK